MGVMADFKVARAKLQAGDPVGALLTIQKIVETSESELQQSEQMYAILVKAGLVGLEAEDFSASERYFRRATELMPNAPQAWKGLIDCLKRAGKVEALPECLERAAQIAEGKGNYSRAQTLRLQLGEVLDRLGKTEEALEALLLHLDNPEAVTVAGDVARDNTCAAERVSLLLLSAVLEVSREDAAVLRLVEKRLLKESGINSRTGTGEASNAPKTRSMLILEYRSKALSKDDDQGGAVSKRLTDAMLALQAMSEGGETDDEKTTNHKQEVWKKLAPRFCRAFLGRTVQRVEAQGDAVAAWQEVKAACALVTKAVVAGAGCWDDDGWVATTTLLSSAYQHFPEIDLFQIAESGANDGLLRPWFSAEACLHLAMAALSDGEGLKAKKHMLAVAAVHEQHASARDTIHSLWIGLSGPGNNWRELALHCLVNERLGYPGADRDPLVALGHADAAIVAFDDSCRLRGSPAAGEYSGLNGRLSLARASLLLRLGRLDDARSSVNVILSAADHSDNRPSINCSMSTTGDLSDSRNTHQEASASGGDARFLSLPCQHCEALCVMSDLELAEGKTEDSKRRLRDVLEVDGSFPGALSRLGWILLGFSRHLAEASASSVVVGAVGGPKRGKMNKEDIEAARPLLERAAAEEPGSSLSTFRLAR